ncbi:MAG: hypothetical protein ACI4R9_04570 [Kiritimatiellia bacterium]
MTADKTDRSVAIAYEAYDIADADDYWLARLVVEDATSPGPIAKISVTDRGGSLIRGARFSLTGVMLDLSEGETVVEFGLFSRNFSNTEVFLVHPGGKRVAGTLKFGDSGVTKSG